MKRLLICLMVLSLMLLSGGTRVACETVPLEPHPDKIEVSHHLYVTSFYDSDFRDLVRWTEGLKSGDELKITIMSGGGPVVPLIAMVNYLEALKARGVHLTTEVAGMSMSAAAILWMMGDERIVHPHDYMMFHGAVVLDVYGRPQSREQMGAVNAWVLDWADHMMRQLLLDTLHDTELVNELMAKEGNLGPDSHNMHFYIGSDIYKMGIATKLEGR